MGHLDCLQWPNKEIQSILPLKLMDSVYSISTLVMDFNSANLKLYNIITNFM